MIAGEVRSPYVPLENERIDRRHAHSVALAAFFRHQKELTGETWRTAGRVLPAPTDGAAPVSLVVAYLSPVPHRSPSRCGGSCPRTCGGKSASRPAPGQSSCATCWRTYEPSLPRTSTRSRKGGSRPSPTARTTCPAVRPDDQHPDAAAADRAARQPQRTAEVRLPGRHRRAADLATRVTRGRKLELSRDLSAAIYEYAPGAEVVAGGRLWTSGGVYRLPEQELLGNYYAVCAECSLYRESPDDDLDPVCPSCGDRPEGRAAQLLEATVRVRRDTPGTDPGMVAPQRSWHGSTYVLSRGAEE